MLRKVQLRVVKAGSEHVLQLCSSLKRDGLWFMNARVWVAFLVERELDWSGSLFYRFRAGRYVLGYR